MHRYSIQNGIYSVSSLILQGFCFISRQSTVMNVKPKYYVIVHKGGPSDILNCVTVDSVHFV